MTFFPRCYQSDRCANRTVPAGDQAALWRNRHRRKAKDSEPPTKLTRHPDSSLFRKCVGLLTRPDHQHQGISQKNDSAAGGTRVDWKSNFLFVKMRPSPLYFFLFPKERIRENIPDEAFQSFQDPIMLVSILNTKRPRLFLTLRPLWAWSAAGT